MHDITVRKMKFEFPDELDDVFPGDDPVMETYAVAFSLAMPYLEPYLIRVYRSFADQIADPELAADVKAFIGQEAQHFQNHRRVNDIIKGRLGPEVAAELQTIEDKLDADYHRYNDEKSRRYNLVYAEGFEAMTCAMALTSFAEVASGERAGALTGAWQQLWAWHTAEEIEHRTVAFDVYDQLEGNWFYRVFGSLRSQIHFQNTIMQFQKVLLKSQGMPAKRHLPPWLRSGRKRYLNTFKPSYNPANLEIDPLVALVLSMYTPT